MPSIVNNIAQPLGFKRGLSLVKVNTPVHDNKSDIMRKFGGCNSCPWYNNSDCPHYPDVPNDHKVHVNGACSKFKTFVIEVTKDNYVGFTKQKQLIELIKDEMIKQKLFEKWRTNPDKIPQELLDWSKHVADTYHKIRKQEEGSKIKVTRKLTPSDVLSAIRHAEGQVVEVTDEVKEAEFTEEEDKDE